MPETTEAPETSTETTGANYPTPPVASTETTGANYPTPPVASTETTFSHEVQSAVPEEGVFVFDPLHEAEMLREIIKGVEIRARDFSNRMKAYTGEIFDKGEVIANSILAIRHIEDARMRYGKCIQYATTGEPSFQK